MRIQTHKPRAIFFGGESELGTVVGEGISEYFEIEYVSRLAVDIRDFPQVNSYLSKIHFDYVFNFAGTLHSSLVVSSDLDAWKRDIEVNCFGEYHILKSQFLLNPRSKHVVISSTAAFNAYPDWSSYCIGKMAQVKLVYSMISAGFDVACFCPGAIDTRFRSGFKIENPKTMHVKTAATPIINHCLEKSFRSGVFLYRDLDSISLLPNVHV